MHPGRRLGAQPGLGLSGGGRLRGPGRDRAAVRAHPRGVGVHAPGADARSRELERRRLSSSVASCTASTRHERTRSCDHVRAALRDPRRAARQGPDGRRGDRAPWLSRQRRSRAAVRRRLQPPRLRRGRCATSIPRWSCTSGRRRPARDLPRPRRGAPGARLVVRDAGSGCRSRSRTPRGRATACSSRCTSAPREGQRGRGRDQPSTSTRSATGR